MVSGGRVRIQEKQLTFEFDEKPQFPFEEPGAANEILDKGYHVVVGNPPYITVKDKAQNEQYRQHFRQVCHQKFSLGVPFTQRFWELAIRQGERINSNSEQTSPLVGYVGMITANSFMKREFGKKLIEEFFPKTDLTHVLDTSGAYIPGHGTPTVILFGRARKPVDSSVRAVLGIKGEPSTPDDPSQGKVWRSIIDHIDKADSQNEFTSSADIPRTSLCTHPWSIGGGGASDLVESLDENATSVLGDSVESIGISAFTLEDDAYLLRWDVMKRLGIDLDNLRELVVGDMLRDWREMRCDPVVFPYDCDFTPVQEDASLPLFHHLWAYRTNLASSKMFGGKTKVQCGLKWFEFGRLTYAKLRSPLTVAFAFIATHNHFVLDRGSKVFNRTAPIIKLPAEASEAEHLELLGLLNCSTACFWMKQTFHNRGDSTDQHGARTTGEPEFNTFEFTSTGLQGFPITSDKPLALARQLDRLGQEYSKLIPERTCEHGTPSTQALQDAKAKAAAIQGRMIFLQEELDWQCYQLYGLLSEDLCFHGDDLPELHRGERAFEFVLARRIKDGQSNSAWFRRHGTEPLVDIPDKWPGAYRQLVERRMGMINANRGIGLVEDGMYKRRWNTEPWEEQEQRALRKWLLDRLESNRYWPNPKSTEPTLQTTAQLVDKASSDHEFMEVAALYKGRADFDLGAFVADLVTSESVPFLPALRYKPSGLRKREVWERTWYLQRKEDAGEDVGTIPVPPKYATADFLKTDFYRLRGKLDVPKERWISYPHCSTESDPSLLVGWAGWNHLQQATAVVANYDARKREGWDAKRLTPLLAGLDQLLPWIHQWHPEIDPEFGETAGQSYETMLKQDAHELGLTLGDIRNWQPPAKVSKAKAGRKKKTTAEDDE